MEVKNDQEIWPDTNIGYYYQIQFYIPESDLWLYAKGDDETNELDEELMEKWTQLLDATQRKYRIYRFDVSKTRRFLGGSSS